MLFLTKGFACAEFAQGKNASKIKIPNILFTNINVA